MKRFLLSLIVCLSALSFAKADGASNFYFYGIDFSMTKVVGASETPAEFAKAFSGINSLMMKEQKKYDLSYKVGHRVFNKVDFMIEQSITNDYSNLIAYSMEMPEYSPEELVTSYPISEKEGTGYVLVAKVLDKLEGMAYYDFVEFDIASRKVLSVKAEMASPFGFGLRNYWAGSVHGVIKK